MIGLDAHGATLGSIDPAAVERCAGPRAAGASTEDGFVLRRDDGSFGLHARLSGMRRALAILQVIDDRATALKRIERRIDAAVELSIRGDPEPGCPFPGRQPR